MCTDCTGCCQVNGLHSWHSCICSLLGSILEAAEDKWEACDSGYSREALLSCQCSSLVSQKYLTKICLFKNPEFFGFFANSLFPSHSSSFFSPWPKSAYSWKFYLLWCYYFGVLHDLQGIIKLVEVQSEESRRRRRCLILLGSIMCSKWLQWLRRSPYHMSTQLWKDLRKWMSNTVLSLTLLNSPGWRVAKTFVLILKVWTVTLPDDHFLQELFFLQNPTMGCFSERPWVFDFFDSACSHFWVIITRHNNICCHIK